MRYMIKDLAILQEARGVQDLGKGKVRFRAKLQELDTYSYNGKKYLTEPMKVGLRKNAPLLEQNGWVGEMDHPIEPCMQRMLAVEYKNSCHVFKEIYTEGNAVWGVMENTSTERGRDLYGLIVKDKIPVGFSIRALGEVRGSGQGQEVYDDIEVITWDCVSTPSFSSSRLTEIVNTNHMESYMLKNDIANLEEYVYGNSEAKQVMLMEAKISEPTHRLVNCVNGVCLFDNNDIKIQYITNMLRSKTLGILNRLK